MATGPSSEMSSESAPGQVEKRERLMRIYDELDDVGKQELLRVALQLSEAR